MQNLHVVLPFLCMLRFTQLSFSWQLLLKRSSGNTALSLHALTQLALTQLTKRITKENLSLNLKTLHVLLTVQLQEYCDLHPFLALALYGNKHQPSSISLRQREEEGRKQEF